MTATEFADYCRASGWPTTRRGWRASGSSSTRSTADEDARPLRFMATTKRARLLEAG
jgi:hypothetical protein